MLPINRDFAATSVAMLSALQVVAWCNIHASGSDEDDVEDRDEDFIQGLTQNEIFEVMLAANFLDIDPLVELAAKSIAMKASGGQLRRRPKRRVVMHSVSSRLSHCAVRSPAPPSG